MLVGPSSKLSPTEIVRETHLSRVTVWRGKVGEVRNPSAESFINVQKVWEREGRPVVK